MVIEDLLGWCGILAEVLEKERVRASVSPEQKLKLHFKTTKNFEKFIFISYL